MKIEHNGKSLFCSIPCKPEKLAKFYSCAEEAKEAVTSEVLSECISKGFDDEPIEEFIALYSQCIDNFSGEWEGA